MYNWCESVPNCKPKVITQVEDELIERYFFKFYQNYKPICNNNDIKQ